MKGRKPNSDLSTPHLRYKYLPHHALRVWPGSFAMHSHRHGRGNGRLHVVAEKGAKGRGRKSGTRETADFRHVRAGSSCLSVLDGVLRSFSFWAYSPGPESSHIGIMIT